jgi:hypothetical protein
MIMARAEVGGNTKKGEESARRDIPNEILLCLPSRDMVARAIATSDDFGELVSSTTTVCCTGTLTLS